MRSSPTWTSSESAGESTDGQAANVRVQELSEQKVAEIDGKNAEMQGKIEAITAQLEEQQTKLQQGQNVMSAEARLSLQRGDFETASRSPTRQSGFPGRNGAVYAGR